jgi:hypothetical protein
MTTKHLRSIATIAALALSLVLVACGGGGSSSSENASSAQDEPAQKTYSHDAVVDPADIDPGWLNDDETTDQWKCVANDSGEEALYKAADALYFSEATNSAGKSVTFVHAENGMKDTAPDLEIVDGHLSTQQGARGEERTVDITFQDDFTCYDAMTKATYVRGDRSAQEYQELFANKTFAEAGGDSTGLELAFSKDGKVTQSQGGVTSEGTWKVVCPSVVVCRYNTDGYEWSERYHFTLGSNDEVKSLDDGAYTSLQARSK